MTQEGARRFKLREAPAQLLPRQLEQEAAMGSEGRCLPAHSTERPARPRVLDQICAIESLVSDRPAVECRLPRRRNKEHPAARCENFASPSAT